MTDAVRSRGGSGSAGGASNQTAHRQQPARVGGGHGLPPTGAVALVLGAGLLGGVIDVVTGTGLRTVFTVLFVIGCVAAAAWVRRGHLAVAVVVPPLAFAVVAIMAGIVDGTGGNGSWLRQQGVEFSAALVINAPAMLLATALAAVVVGIRAVRGRSHQR